jgi:phenylacetate-coenzyme A ligase PaaK-like adenylate-forming protein
MPISVSYAIFDSDLKILEKKDIHKLTDEQLIDAYLNTMVEIEANRAFHTTAGFTPKEFKAYKDLLKFRLELLLETHSRNLEIPQFERYNPQS